MAVTVILKQDVPHLGNAGEVKQVAPGYFRNFLQPRGMAVEASKGQLAALHARANSQAAQSTRAREQSDSLARRIQDTPITISVHLGEQGRIYGSVTNKDIADQLQQQLGIQIDRHKIELREPLKSLGVHSVPVKLDQGVEAEARVELVAEGGELQA